MFSSGFDKEMQADIKQEIYFQIWLSIDSFEGRSKLKTWVQKVATNVTCKFRRTHAKRWEQINFEGEDCEEHSLEGARLPIDGCLESEEAKMVVKKLGKFKPQNSVCFCLYLLGESIGDIAEVMGVSSSNVSTIVNRIKVSLQESIEMDKKREGL